MKLFISIFYLVFYISCQNSRTEISYINSIDDSLKIQKDSNTYYFPLKPFTSFRDNSYNVAALDTFSNAWFSKHLYSLGEPVISRNNNSQLVFRFTWLRTFHRPVVIRIENKNDSIFLVTKMSSGQGGYDPGKIVINRTQLLSAAAWTKFETKIKELNFFNLSTEDDNTERLGTDGSEWILEGKINNKYHFAYRWMPSEKEYEKFRGCCEYLISLSHFSEKELPKDDKY